MPSKSLQTGFASALLVALSLLIFGNLLATGADVFVKIFSSSSGIYQYLFLRKVTLFLLIAPFFFLQSREKRRLSNVKVHVSRGALTCIGGGCVVLALSTMTLAAANVVFYAAPVLTMLFARIWLAEQLQTHRIICVVSCFVGVVVALRPEGFGLGALAAFVAANCIAFYNLTVRFVDKDVSNTSVMFWGCVMSLPILAIASVWHWQEATWSMLYLVVGSTLCLAGYQLCSVLAYRNAEAGAITIAEYSGLLFAAALGWLWFDEKLDFAMAMGIALIVLPMMLHTRFESKKSKRMVEADNNLV